MKQDTPQRSYAPGAALKCDCRYLLHFVPDKERHVCECGRSWVRTEKRKWKREKR
jgi:hypothetical protein